MKIGFIGSGNMGQALAAGVLRAGLAGNSSIKMSDKDGEKLKSVEKNLGINGTKVNNELVEWADTIILAVKPGIIPSVIEEIKSVVTPSKLVISIAAGVTISLIEQTLAGEIPVVRAMPNTPALVNQGATAIAIGHFADTSHMERANSIFSAVGVVVTVDESMMDAITALSGSGPAYIFFVAEVMEEAGKKLGLQPEMVQKLVRQTISGSAKMLVESDSGPRGLREKVTSPGGTTESALNFLKKSGFEQMLVKAISAAARRSEELSKYGL